MNIITSLPLVYVPIAAYISYDITCTSTAVCVISMQCVNIEVSIMAGKHMHGYNY